MAFRSDIRLVGSLAFPDFAGTRVMMLPFRIEEPRASLPDSLARWRPAVAALCDMSDVRSGVGYLTIDEALVRAGETHRRPGLHVDGIGPDGMPGAWGGGGGGWGRNGMLVAASRFGCVGWAQDFDGEPGADGDCAHLRDQASPDDAISMRAGEVYWCGPLAVHESVPMTENTARQFVRLSMPSDAPWFEGYTENPLGVRPTGPILPARAAQMAYRAAT